MRVAGHALRWVRKDYGDGSEDAYDPFNPKGPWTVSCECGAWSKQVPTRREGRWFHKLHKVACGPMMKKAERT